VMQNANARFNYIPRAGREQNTYDEAMRKAARLENRLASRSEEAAAGIGRL